MTRRQNLTVYYDGACPLCAREIAFYRRKDKAGNVTWIDVSALSDSEHVAGLSREQTLARFHVRTPDGRLVTGGAAFAQLWTVIPGLRLLGRVMQRPPFLWVLNLAYRGFLRVHPWVQSAVRQQAT
ncbi:MAG: DUF393 domain-containing protein [Alphaproteobacteria bacterium]